MLRFVSASVLLLVGLGLRADEAVSQKMLKELEGDYRAISMSRTGEPAPRDFLAGVSFSIKRDTFTIHFNNGKTNEDKVATIVIDVTEKPIAIDLTPRDGPQPGKSMLGIIKVEKGTITLCFCDRGSQQERPREFTSTKENMHFLIVMEKR